MDPNKVKFTAKEFLRFLLLFVPLCFAFILWKTSLFDEKGLKIYIISAIAIPLLITGFYMKNKAFNVYAKDKNKNEKLISYYNLKSNGVMYFLLILFLAYIITLAIFNKDLFWG